ncbi:MAG: PorT family protein [Prevotellaceae bacterium]|jgi:hypothetical protein|nr:PorT family protein [Prevotellaceae bacterium]
MRKFVLFAALAAGTITGAAAQKPIEFGARAGLNFDSQKQSRSNESETSDSKLGFHLGVVADIPLANLASSLPSWFYFQPGLYFTTKGGKESSSWQGMSSTSTASLYYLELPLRASVKYPLAGSFCVRAHVGPSVGFAVSGKSKTELTQGGKTQSNEGDYFENDDVSRFHFGLDFGAGVEYKQLHLGVGYDLGLSNMYTGDGDLSIKNRTLGVSLGYNF